MAGIVRVILLDEYDRNIPANYTHSVLFCLSTIEVGLSFVAACAPSFKPLVARLLPKLFSSTRGERYYNGSASRSGRGRLGYDLGNMSNYSRRTQDQNVTVIEADGELDYGPATVNTKNTITMTTQMEVTWDHSIRKELHTSSTESLVHGK